MDTLTNFVGGRRNKGEKKEEKKKGRGRKKGVCIGFHSRQRLLDKISGFLEQSGRGSSEARPTQSCGRYCGQVIK